MKNTLIVMLLILLFGCKPKLVYVENTKTDTLRVNKIVKIVEPKLTELVFNELCDSLGNLRPFKFKTSSGSVKTIIESRNDTIFIHQNIDSIKQVAIDIYKSKTATKTEVKERTVYPKIFWWSICLNILVFLYIFMKVKKMFSFS